MHTSIRHILRTTQSTPAFRSALYVIRHWANQRGVLSGKCGYFNPYALTIMLSHVSQHLPSATDEGLVNAFFETFATFPFSTRIITCDGWVPTAAEDKWVRGGRGMCVVSVGVPRVNVVRNVTEGTCNVLVGELKRAWDVVQRGGGVEEVWEDGVGEFFTSYPTYILLTLSSLTPSSYRSLVGHIESRLVSLLVILSTRCTNAETRLWPVRGKWGAVTGYPYSGAVWVGVRKKGDGKVVQSDFLAALDEFERQVFERWEEKTKDMFFHIELVPKSKVPQTIEEDTLPDGDVEVEAAESEHANEDDGASGETANEQGDDDVPSTTTSTQRPTTSPPSPTTTTHPKLRTSRDVFHRILWDTSLDSSLYTVGYEDRFQGILEISFKEFAQKCRGDETDEEWMPWHRVWWYKKAGEVVWDRKGR
ncbi:hypothetical protein HK104_007078, partial [Borealophlyctis nickersoniae]